jgi:lipoprotein-anchoring transpeptidase ErfK/SrfK
MSSLRLVFMIACAPLAACNPSLDHPQLAATSVTGSYTGYRSDEPLAPPAPAAPRRPDLAREVVDYKGPERPGTIIVKTHERRLYLVLSDEKALRYPVGVGTAGKQWQGRAAIDGAYVQPAWAPTPEIRRDSPNLPDVIPGGAPGNPMGPRALTLTGDKYAIHGTNRPHTIGTFASYGCIRMFNEDIVDLFGRVGVGTEVVVSL